MQKIFRKDLAPTKKEITVDLRGRLDRLEKSYVALVNGINGVNSKVGRELVTAQKAISVLIDMVGPEAFEAKLKEREALEAARELQTAQAAIDQKVADGELVAVESVDPNSFVVGQETIGDGSQPSQRVEVYYADLQEDFQTKFLGKAVGDTIETQFTDAEGKVTSGSFLITGIYHPAKKTE